MVLSAQLAPTCPTNHHRATPTRINKPGIGPLTARPSRMPESTSAAAHAATHRRMRDGPPSVSSVNSPICRLDTPVTQGVLAHSFCHTSGLYSGSVLTRPLGRGYALPRLKTGGNATTIVDFSNRGDAASLSTFAILSFPGQYRFDVHCRF